MTRRRPTAAARRAAGSPPQPGEVIDRATTAARSAGTARRYTALPRRHDRLGAGRGRRAGVLPQLQVPPAARAAHRQLPRPRLHWCRSATSRTSGRRTAWSSAGMEVQLAEHVAVAALRRQGGQPGWSAGSSRAGFYYKTFIKPQRLWPAYEKVLAPVRARRRGHRRPDAARLLRQALRPPRRAGRRRRAGRAWPRPSPPPAPARGSCSSRRSTQLGGHLRWGGAGRAGAAARAARPGRRQRRHRGAHRLGGRSAATTTTGSPSCSAACPGVDGAPGQGPGRDARGRPPGLIERPYVFAGNDLPGVMLSTAVRRLINLYAVRPGERAVVLTANADGRRRGRRPRRAPASRSPRVVDARRGDDVVRAHGRRGVLARSSWPTGAAIECRPAGHRRRLDGADLAAEHGRRPPGLRPAAARFVPTADAARRRPGRRRASSATAASTSSSPTPTPSGARRPRRRARAAAPASVRRTGGRARPLPGRRPAPGAVPRPAPTASSTSPRTCRAKDLAGRGRGGLRLGRAGQALHDRRPWARPRASSRRSTPSPSSPRPPARTIAETGTTIWRPPYAPVTLGALAGRQLRAGPRTRRCSRGTSATAPCRWSPASGSGPTTTATRPPRCAACATRVGIIDVTPIGKLDLRGPDVPKLLNLLYVNKWSKLADRAGPLRRDVRRGRRRARRRRHRPARRGPLPDVDHVVGGGDRLGVGGELAADRAPRLAVHVTPVTTAYASINVAGPSSRELLGRLAEASTSSAEAFPYMSVRTGTVAGVADCVLWRIGFTGELSLRDPRARRVRPARLGGAARGRAPTSASRRSASRRSGSCGWRRATHRRAGHRRADPGVRRRPRRAGQAGQARLRRAARARLAAEQRGDGTRAWSACSPVDGSVVPAGGQPDRSTGGRRTSSGGSPPAGCRRHSAARSAWPSSTPSWPPPAPRSRSGCPTARDVTADGHRAPGPRRPRRGAPACLTDPAAAGRPGRPQPRRRLGPPGRRRRVGGAAPGAATGRPDARRRRRRWPRWSCARRSPGPPATPSACRSAAPGAPTSGRRARSWSSAPGRGSGWCSAAPGTAGAWRRRSSERLGGAPGSSPRSVDLTHGRALMRLTGARRRPAAARRCARSTSPTASRPDGSALRTSVAKVVTDVVRDDQAGSAVLPAALRALVGPVPVRRAARRRRPVRDRGHGFA